MAPKHLFVPRKGLPVAKRVYIMWLFSGRSSLNWGLFGGKHFLTFAAAQLPSWGGTGSCAWVFYQLLFLYVLWFEC